MLCSVVLATLLPIALSAQDVRPALVRAKPPAPTVTPDAVEAAGPAARNATVKKSLAALRKALDAFPDTIPSVEPLLSLDLETATTLGELRSLAATTPALERQVDVLQRAVSTLQQAVTGLQQSGVKRQQARDDALFAIREIETALGLKEEEKGLDVPDTVAMACNGLADPPGTDYRFVDLQQLSAPITQKEAESLERTGKIDVEGLLSADATIKAYALTGVCSTILEIQRSEATDGDTSSGHRALIEAQLSLSRLRKWQRSMFSHLTTSVDTARPRAQLAHASTTIEDQMQDHGLKRLLSASMFAGTIQGPSGVTLEGDSVVSGREHATQVKQTFTAQPSVVVNIDSLHFGWEGDHLLDASVRGSVGFRPIQTIVAVGGLASKSSTKTETSTTTIDGTTTTVKTDVTTTDSTKLDATMASVLQQAFVFSGGGRVGLSSRANIETSLTGQLFATVLTDDKLIVESPNATSVIASGANDAGLAAGGGEVGIDVRFYDAPLRVIHGEGSTLSPWISVGAGIRYDSRFKATGALQDLDLGHAERRWYAHLTFDPVKFLDGREVGDKAKTYDVGLGVEYDAPFKTGGSIKVPQSFKFLIRGDFNILSAAGGDSKKEDENK
jgi:hypothetical protein